MRHPAPRILAVLSFLVGALLLPFLFVADVPCANAKTSKKIPVVSTLTGLGPNDGRLISIDVVVTLPPDMLGSRTFATKEKSGDAGMAVRAFGTDALPSLSAGDTVRVIGRQIGQSHGLPLLSSAGKKIKRLSSGKITYETREVGRISKSDAGASLLLTGIVTHVAKRSFSISDNRGRNEIEVVMPMNALMAKVPTGATVEVRGVLLAGTAGLQLMIADKNAMKVEAPPKAAATDDAAAKTGVSALETTQQGTGSFSMPIPKSYWLIGIGVLAALLAGTAAWSIRRRRTMNNDVLTENR